jgi:hypothetical protein
MDGAEITTTIEETKAAAHPAANRPKFGPEEPVVPEMDASVMTAT